MGNRAVITRQSIKDTEYLFTALFEDHRMLEVSCSDVKKTSLLGNVYIGKIKRIIDKIGAAFVELFPGQMSYLSLKDVKTPMMARQCRQGKLTEEDEIVVQVVKEAAKTKDPTVSTNISFKGNALILTTENKTFGVSKKLPDEKWAYFQAFFEEKTAGQKEEEFGLIIRTNAKNYSKEQLSEEFCALYEQFRYLKTYYKTRVCHSCLYHSPPAYISDVRDYLSLHLEKIVTDDPAVFQELLQAFEQEKVVTEGRIELYEDALLSLSALYSFKSKLEEALSAHVWLKSGAYLVISPTEALTVIDVNSGRCITGKQENFYLKVNLEAAEEIAKQLRLRNISGICIVDFINLDTKETQEKLAEAFKGFLAKDKVPAVFVGFTKLGLAEITRKKIKKPLWEQIDKRDFDI